MSIRRTLLLVEDEELVRGFLVRLLEKAAWQLTAVANGSAALSRLSASRFDVILCDLDLGGGPSGLDVLRGRSGLNRDTPFVVLTGHGTVGRCREALLMGASDFVEKPTSSQQLLLILDQVTGIVPCITELTATGEDVPVVDDHVRLALRVIDAHYANPDFSVADLAKESGVSREHLARLCRTHLGRSPLEQIHLVRINAAQRLLGHARVSVFEAAVDCGYRTTKDFDIWFRRFHKMTPSQWRATKPR